MSTELEINFSHEGDDKYFSGLKLVILHRYDEEVFYYKKCGVWGVAYAAEIISPEHYGDWTELETKIPLEKALANSLGISAPLGASAKCGLNVMEYCKLSGCKTIFVKIGPCPVCLKQQKQKQKP